MSSETTETYTGLSLGQIHQIAALDDYILKSLAVQHGLEAKIRPATLKEKLDCSSGKASRKKKKDVCISFAMLVCATRRC